MQGETVERLFTVCKLIANEQNPDRLLQLVAKLHNLLEQKQKRLDMMPPNRGDDNTETCNI